MATSKRKGVVDAQKKATTRVNLQVDAEAHERLLIHAIKLKESPGAIVSRLIDEHLREYRVQKNPSARATQGVSAEIDGGGENSLEVAA
jgi:hypothetical protein